MLYSCEQRKLFECQDVEFEEIEDWERVMIDSDSNGEGVDARFGDPEGDQVNKTIDNNDGDTIDAPSMPPKAVDHQEASRTSPDNPVYLDTLLPHHLAHSNQGVPPICPDEDLKLDQGTRSCARETQAPGAQNPDIISVGNGSRESSLHVDDADLGALYLVADTPQLY